MRKTAQSCLQEPNAESLAKQTSFANSMADLSRRSSSQHHPPPYIDLQLSKRQLNESISQPVQVLCCQGQQAFKWGHVRPASTAQTQLPSSKKWTPFELLSKLAWQRGPQFGGPKLIPDPISKIGPEQHLAGGIRFIGGKRLAIRGNILMGIRESWAGIHL